MNLEAYKSQASICYAGTDAQWSPQVLHRLKEDPPTQLGCSEALCELRRFLMEGKSFF